MQGVSVRLCSSLFETGIEADLLARQADTGLESMCGERVKQIKCMDFWDQAIVATNCFTLGGLCVSGEAD